MRPVEVPELNGRWPAIISADHVAGEERQFERTIMPSLFTPLQLGALELPNRILMAPLTRARAGRDGVPNELMARYYAQRAGAGLIISEATGISRGGLGWPNAPGLWNQAQVDGWKAVTGAVHRDGGRIVAPPWDKGRLV